MKNQDLISDKKTYICIDLKSFYASVEAASRHLDPLKTHLVVADKSRTSKTICLAVSPSLKELGISGRARLFEVVERVKVVNKERMRIAGSKGDSFSGTSYDAEELASDPSLEVSYIVASPRMKLYEEVSTKIFSIYMRFISPEDIHVYSIDECFMDVTPYLSTYETTPHELAMKMIRCVLEETGITATAGIGTNMYLAKIAMDIVAKHAPADEQGVRIAELNEKTYRELLWCHTPITDFWRVGPGISKRLSTLNCFTMGDVARLSIKDEDKLYDLLGINAELLIDHAWGYEPTVISTIKSYKPTTNSLSSGQVLMEPYEAEKAKIIVREMTELLVLDIVKKGLVTKKIELTINYDRTSIEYEYKGRNLSESTFLNAKTKKRYTGKVSMDYYGRPAPYHAHSTGNVDRWTSSTSRIMDVMMGLFDKIVDTDLTIRRINIAALNLIPEDDIPSEAPYQMNLFTDYEAIEKQKQVDAATDQKEKNLQKATLQLQEKFGKNAVLKGTNLQEGATTIQRNNQIGGHNSGEI